MYVRIIGTIKEFQQKKAIQITRIQTVTDHNELNYHYLDAIHTYLLLQRGFQAIDFQPDLSGFTNTNDGIHRSIIETIQSNHTEDGCSREYLEQTLRIPSNELRDHINYLMSEGHVYTTIDEDHFHCTN